MSIKVVLTRFEGTKTSKCERRLNTTLIASKWKGWGVMISLFFCLLENFGEGKFQHCPPRPAGGQEAQHRDISTAWARLYWGIYICPGWTKWSWPKALWQRLPGSCTTSVSTTCWHRTTCWQMFRGDCIEERFGLSPRHGQSFAGCSQQRGIQRKSTFTAKFCGSSSFTRILYLWIGTYIQDR